MKIATSITLEATGEPRTVYSEEFEIEVLDPCATTTILASGFSKVMSAPRLGYDSLTIGDEIPSPNWPWITSVDSATNFAFSPELCGPIQYSVYADVAGQL